MTKTENFSTGSICYSYVAFKQTPDVGKKRPTAILMEVNSDQAAASDGEFNEGDYICYTITSKEPEAWYKHLYYEIKDYKECGLNRPSYINCSPSEFTVLPKSSFNFKGEMTTQDKVGFVTKVNELRTTKKKV